jgi:hypothetical protein
MCVIALLERRAGSLLQPTHLPTGISDKYKVRTGPRSRIPNGNPRGVPLSVYLRPFLLTFYLVILNQPTHAFGALAWGLLSETVKVNFVGAIPAAGDRLSCIPLMYIIPLDMITMRSSISCSRIIHQDSNPT